MKTNTATNHQHTFADILREYERYATAYTADTTAKPLTDLATAVAYSILKKCINVSQSPALIQLKRDLARDLHKALTDLCGRPFGDGLDLVNDAIVAILTETEKAKDRNGQLPPCFMEQTYAVRRLKRKVWIKVEESVNGWEQVTTTAIQEVFKSVRRAVEQSRAVESTSKYIYLQDLATDTESESTETIYRRLPKYADLGGSVTDFNGKETAYTADEQTVYDLDTLIESMNLTAKQAKVLALRQSGYGYKSIATYLGVTQRAVAKTVEAIQVKAVATGLQPTK